jgi:hypothetical protein
MIREIRRIDGNFAYWEYLPHGGSFKFWLFSALRKELVGKIIKSVDVVNGDLLITLDNGTTALVYDRACGGYTFVVNGINAEEPEWVKECIRNRDMPETGEENVDYEGDDEEDDDGDEEHDRYSS